MIRLLILSLCLPSFVGTALGGNDHHKMIADVLVLSDVDAANKQSGCLQHHHSSTPDTITESSTTAHDCCDPQIEHAIKEHACQDTTESQLVEMSCCDNSCFDCVDECSGVSLAIPGETMLTSAAVNRSLSIYSAKLPVSPYQRPVIPPII